MTELYDPKAFITHAALLRQAFAHCAKFLTAASRRSLDRVPVPVWLIILSDQLTIDALVGSYPTKANGTRTHLQTIACKQRLSFIINSEKSITSSGISTAFAMLSQIQR